MNTTQNMIKVLRQTTRCSRLSVRGLTTAKKTFQNGLMQKCGVRVDIFKPKLVSQIMRHMSSAVKFEVINVQDEEDFKKRVLETSSTTPVVVDFHARWCGPCKILGPRLETLLSQGDGKVLMAKVDIDENPELAMEYGVQSVPTVVGVRNGKVLNQFVGVKDDDQINAFVDKLAS